VIIFASPTVPEAQAIARILEIFWNASGLRTNLAKCSITPIYGADHMMQQIQLVLPCHISPFPITYLGIPLSTGAIPRSYIKPLGDKVVARLPAWKGQLMPKSGRLVLTKAVLSTIPTYTIMAEQLPAWAIEEIYKIRRKFFWAGHDSSVRGKCLVAWVTVCLPTTHGGLGVTDLRIAGLALRTRWLWLQRTDPDRAWASLPVKVEPEIQQFFEASITVRVGNGANTLFWTDNWLDGESLVDLAPALIMMVSPQIKKNRTVQQALQNRNWVRDITGGLSVIAIIEYLHLWDNLEDIQLLPEQEDVVRWR
jgi:hypothetical protein